MSHRGSGRVIPLVPFVSESQLIATIWRMKSAAIVMITNANPLVRIAITPRNAAKRAAATPATGTQTNGSPPIFVVAIPTV
jgi:hypothetical protein